MTTKEQIEYEKLTPEQKTSYNNIYKEHPNWSHKQLMCSVTLIQSTLSGCIVEEKESIWKSIKRFFS